MQKHRGNKKKSDGKHLPAANVFVLLRKYVPIIVTLVILTLIANGLTISVPKIISHAIDTYVNGTFVFARIAVEFSLVAVLIFVFTYGQNIVQVYASEKIARDLRNDIIAKISMQPYAYIERVTPAKILTNLTSDVDAVKTFVSTAVSSVISSVFLIFGVSVLLLLTDWKLALIVLSIVPLIAGVFYVVLKRVRALFTKAQEAIDWLNKVISESISGAALVRLLNSTEYEWNKFHAANVEARDVSFGILRLFSTLIPIITFLTNIAILAIVMLGGHFVIQGGMTLGNFTAFYSYLAILIFPIFILGFVSNLISQAQISYGRIAQVVQAPVAKNSGTVTKRLRGYIVLRNVSLRYGQKTVLKNVSFALKAGSKTAIIGPTAAGKTQLLYLLSGLLKPTEGEILFDGLDINAYDTESLYRHIGLVFQDSVMFNLSVRENIAFSNFVKDAFIEKAIKTAELQDYIVSLPQQLDTVVSERGTSLSGGQKQRIMLARALAIDPMILLLDDFTARVDAYTEEKIVHNLAVNYPEMTVISVTQKISSVENYDQIIVLMEGEVIAIGTHDELMHASPEYVQIYQSQRSTSYYESHNEK